VAARTCPYCLTKMPRITIITRSYDLVCAGCGRPVEISRVSRDLAAFIGLIAGAAGAYLGYEGAITHHHSIGFVLPMTHAIVFYGVVAAVVLFFTADLSLKSEPHAAPTHEPSDPHAGGHGASHH
jgi:hypothetical protein